MARPGRLGFGVGVVAGATAYAVLASGAVTAGVRDVGGALGDILGPPSAVAEGLPAFGDCEQLRQWYVARALPHVGPWGLAGPPVMYATDVERSPGEAVPQTTEGSAATGSQDAVGTSATGTNVQEQDVDEADVAKSDGSRVYRVRDGRLVVTDVTGEPRELASVDLPGGPLGQPQLLLDGDRVLVVGTEQRWTVGGPMAYRPLLPTGDQSRTRLVTLDVSDPASPRVTGDELVDGSAVSARSYADGTVRAVVTTGYPPLDFVQPNRDRSPRQATEENRRIVRAAPVSAWLPSLRTAGGDKRPVLECDQVRHPRVASGLGTISVLTFGLDDPGDLSATAVTASGELVYSSADRLYVATTDEVSGPVPMVGGAVAGDDIAAPPSVRTEVHAFALDGGRTTYVASGTVPGSVRDRWSFDEQDGRLRVATGLGSGWQPTDNAVVVLEEHGDRLRQVGRVAGLGRGEAVQAVRWLGDLALVVTFRQTDPLYTVDLSDPAHPRVVGALEVNGYSSYLHPVGGDRVVGLGHDATAQGSDLGAQAASFDLRDLAHVRRTATLRFGRGTDLPAGDGHLFAYLPDQRVFLALLTDWTRGGQRFVAVHVGEDGALRRVGSWTASDASGDVRALPLGGGRVALVGDTVRVVDVG